MNKYIAAALAALLSASTVAQQVEHVTVGDNYNYGITYSLPITAMQIKVKARCTTTQAGTYAMYAEKLLGLHDVALADQTSYELTDLRLESVARADTSHTYHIVFSEKGALPTFYFADEHCLWGINHEPEAPATEPAPTPAVQKSLRYKPTDVLTTDILKAGSKSKQAELIAKEIFSIRESRAELIRGEADNVPNDGQQLQLMLDNLTAQEEALLTFFVGTTTNSEQERTFCFIPRAESERELVFRFSTELGFVDVDDMAGSPYYISVSIVEDNRMSEMDIRARKRLEKGIAYCVPGKAHVRVFDTYHGLAEGDVLMAQFGHVEQLPQAQFTDKKKPCSALFTPATGAIRIFEQ